MLRGNRVALLTALGTETAAEPTSPREEDGKRRVLGLVFFFFLIKLQKRLTTALKLNFPLPRTNDY